MDFDLKNIKSSKSLLGLGTIIAILLAVDFLMKLYINYHKVKIIKDGGIVKGDD
jgi:hypothetical protein